MTKKNPLPPLKVGDKVTIHGREATILSKHQYSSTGHNWWVVSLGGKETISPEDIMKR